MFQNNYSKFNKIYSKIFHLILNKVKILIIYKSKCTNSKMILNKMYKLIFSKMKIFKTFEILQLISYNRLNKSNKIFQILIQLLMIFNHSNMKIL